ncbi:MAG: serine acetyltransferase [Candidatus Sumerlaeia bacterium]|nr:serine acetyltransferase [Candidatus Sumerlaeia bacterium]
MTAKSKDFSVLVNDILASYKSEPRTCHIDSGTIPNHEKIVALIGLFRALLFPGYFGRHQLKSKTISYHLGTLVEDIHDELKKLVTLAYLHEIGKKVATTSEANSCAEKITYDLLAQIPCLRSVLAKDAQAAFDGDPAASSIEEIILSYPGYFAIVVYRLAHELYIRGVPLIPRIMTEHAHSLTGVDIHPGAVIDEYFFMDHGTGIVIGATTVIGKNVKIYQGVTLGALSTRGGQKLRDTKRHPTLEDNVTVYSGASILGGETVIGTGAVISSNVFVTKSVPAHTRVTVKNPELQYRNQRPTEFSQEMPPDWVI